MSNELRRLNGYIVLVLSMFFANTGCNKHCIKPACDTCNASQLFSQQYQAIVSPEIKIQNLNSFLEDRSNRGQSFSVLFAQDTKVLYAKGFGCAKACEMTNAWSTIFDIGSLTKVFTAMAIGQLQEVGKLAYLDPLVDFFPDISADKKGITIHQLLTHSSGLDAFHDKKGDFEIMDRDKVLKRIGKQKLLFAPGTSYSYSNSGFTLLAYIVEKLSGMNFKTYCAQNIFDKLGMHHTGFHGDFSTELDVAYGYGDNCYGENNPISWPEPSGALLGNGGAISTAEDLLKWVMNAKSLAISPLSWDHMVFQHIVNTRYDGIFGGDVYQGYGWNIYSHPTIGKIIFMGGSNEYGYVCRLKYYENSNAVLIILMNNYQEEMENPVIAESVIMEMESILF